MHQIALPALEAVVSLTPCEVPPPVPVVTMMAPVREHQSLYLAAGACLYAVNAADGTARWCQHVKLTRTREVRYPPRVSVPPPPRLHFATPRVMDGANGTNGAVYVCIEGWVSCTCAFAAADGALRWWTPTDARVASMPFMDWAVPLVSDGIVYSGTYALNHQDGAVRWRIAIDTDGEGTLALHALVDQTLYATTHRGIYAINAQDGQIRWLYPPADRTRLSGPPVIAGHLLFAGTSGSIGHEEQSYFCALDADTGAEVWRYPNPRGGYIGAVVHHETIYVSSGDGFLYALDAKSGALRWQHRVGASGYSPATVDEDVLFLTINSGGVYALRSANGAVLWHQPLEASPSVSFCPLVVLDGAVNVVRLDRHGSVLYSLDARTGTECWHTPYPSRGAGIGVAQ